LVARQEAGPALRSSAETSMSSESQGAGTAAGVHVWAKQVQKTVPAAEESAASTKRVAASSGSGLSHVDAVHSPSSRLLAASLSQVAREMAVQPGIAVAPSGPGKLQAVTGRVVPQGLPLSLPGQGTGSASPAKYRVAGAGLGVLPVERDDDAEAAAAHNGDDNDTSLIMPFVQSRSNAAGLGGSSRTAPIAGVAVSHRKRQPNPHGRSGVGASRRLEPEFEVAAVFPGNDDDGTDSDDHADSPVRQL
jgi:hypothetical protein